jgi:hypothetical protein
MHGWKPINFLRIILSILRNPVHPVEKLAYSDEIR